MTDSPLLFDKGIISMIGVSGPVVSAVLLLLIVLSVWSWTITIAKALQYRKAFMQTKEFWDLFWESRDLSRIEDSSHRLDASPLARVFHAGYRELTKALSSAEGEGNLEANLETVTRMLERAEYEEATRLEKGLPFLATVASAAPFIGLFGTVWGIMSAFHGLQFAKSTTIQAVAPGISEALVATAVGLVAAIPAAVAYNFLAVNLRRFKEAMRKFSEEFVSFAKGYF